MMTLTKQILISCVVFLLIGTPCVLRAESLDQLTIERGKFFCEWAQTSAPAGNPKPLSFCRDSAPRPQNIDEQMANWWGYWYQQDGDAAAHLQTKFNNEWGIASHPDSKTPPAELVSEKLCMRFARTHSTEDRTEIKRRKLLTAAEWALVDAQRVRVGMSEIALRCSFGEPDSVNRTVVTAGSQKQYVYGSSYVYVQNGHVTAFQDSR